MPRDNRCMYMTHVCCSDCVGGQWECLLCSGVVKNSVFLTLECLIMLCVCVGDVMDVVSSCRCCMFVSCVHPVAVHNATFCMTCSLLMLVEDARSDHTEEAYTRAGLITAL